MSGGREWRREAAGRAVSGRRRGGRPPVQPAPERRPAPVSAAVYPCEALVVEGLEAIARDELRRVLGERARLRPPAMPGAVRFDYAGELPALFGLRTVQAVSLVRRFAVPRPRALLGDEHFRALLGLIALARGLHPPDAFATLVIGAAGAESAVMRRLRDELARATGLAPGEAEGDLQLRLRRPPGGDDGWEALVRLSPRPLATRPWRVCNREGALNATVAHALALLTRPRPDDVFLNLACGSGTILIERRAAGPARRLVGCDTDAAALACARANVAAAGYGDLIELQPWDAAALPLPAAGVDALAADLPFGHLVGSHAENVGLYPAILREAARVARPGARLALITHEVRLMERLLAGRTNWSVEATLRITLGGLHPRIFVLMRAGGILT